MDYTTQEESLDSFLLSVLQNNKNRDTLKKLEETLNQFVKNSELQRLEFPPKTAFQRRIIHRVALRYGLDNLLLAAENNGTNSDKRRLILLKTEHTKIPNVLLSEWDKSVPKRGVVNELRQTPTENTNNKPFFLKRNEPNGVQRTLHRSSSCGGLEAGTGNVIRGVTEEEYQKARARIFNSNSVSQCSQTQVGTKMTVSEELSCIPSPDIPSHSFQPFLATDETRTGEDNWVTFVEEKETENDVYDPDFDRSYSRWGATIPMSTCANNSSQNLTDSYPHSTQLRPPIVGNYINQHYTFASKNQNAPLKGLESSSMMPRNISPDHSLTSSYPSLQFPSYQLHCSFGDSSQVVGYIPNNSVSTTSNDTSIYLSKDPSSYIHEFPPLGRT
ncbi:hypothetical protein GpartN1_g2260.t1 [Galdieria partita]|uniref:R3H domain-containing protein n=1 Tax=Galdieria partita TaxID=83374 RepID=A0A9C7PU15_9RHOD|nr:hypothetical protein GpartN1_g2260.t1 [Galdieria partita]